MDDLAYYLAGVLTLVAAAVKLGHARARTPGVFYLCGLLGFLGLAAITLAPTTLRLSASVEPVPNVTRLVGNLLAIGAVFCLLGMLAHAAYPIETARRRMRGQVWVLAAAAIAMTTLFLAARTTFTVDFVNAYATEPVVAAYEVVFLSYASWGIMADIILVTRVARDAHRSFVRSGLWVGLTGAWFGLAWALWKISVTLTKVTTERSVPLEGEVSSLLSAAAILFVALGATVTAWGPHVAHPVLWWHARLRYRRIEPLWSALHAAVPDVEFQPPGAGMEFRLYHRIVEIRDSGLLLRRYFHPRVQEWVDAETSRLDITDEDERAVLAEAAALAAALEARAANHPFGGQASSSPALDADIDVEAAWLSRVTHAFTSSPVVETVRRRVRDDLPFGDHESGPGRAPRSTSAHASG